jgi:pimeloyl-ACP methyl ester carboxylesterase
MSDGQRIARRLAKAFLPILLVILAAIVSVAIWLVHTITRPPRAPYLLTPQTFTKVSGAILKVTDVTWPNHDGTQARGWLARGDEGAPGIILLHPYGADRSWLLNLAIKLNETTHFTVLWPDLRGHGENPAVNWSLFGSVEGDDAAAALEYLRDIKGPSGKPQINGRVGIYGIELGAYAALSAARGKPEVRALALDSAPASPDDLISAITNSRTGTNISALQKLAGWGVRVYGAGKYHGTPSCELASSLRDVRVLLLAGGQGDRWLQSTSDLARCFGTAGELKKELPVTGMTLLAATSEQEEAYDRPVIEFFDKALR